MTTLSPMLSRRARAIRISGDDVDRLIGEIERYRALTIRHSFAEMNERIQTLIQRADRMLALADDDLAPRLRSARALLHCLSVGVAAAA